MTNEEALDVLIYLTNCEDVNTRHKEAIEIAIEALEQKEKIGYWFVDKRPESGREVICSNCEQPVFKYHKLEFDYRPNYCPNCGIKMRLGHRKYESKNISLFEEKIKMKRTYLINTLVTLLETNYKYDKYNWSIETSQEFNCIEFTVLDSKFEKKITKIINMRDITPDGIYHLVYDAIKELEKIVGEK